MADKPKTETQPKPQEIEADPGAWERFEHAVDAAVASGPKHREAKPLAVANRLKGSKSTNTGKR